MIISRQEMRLFSISSLVHMSVYWTITCICVSPFDSLLDYFSWFPVSCTYKIPWMARPKFSLTPMLYRQMEQLPSWGENSPKMERCSLTPWVARAPTGSQSRCTQMLRYNRDSVNGISDDSVWRFCAENAQQQHIFLDTGIQYLWALNLASSIKTIHNGTVTLHYSPLQWSHACMFQCHVILSFL